MIALPNYTLIKIYTFYWGTQCKYKDKEGLWNVAPLDSSIIPYIMNKKCRLILKDLASLKAEDIVSAYKIMAKLLREQHKESDGESHYTDALTISEAENIKGHFIDNIVNAPYPIVDYLRRRGFHVPVFGLDLFLAGIAEKFKEKKEIETINTE